MAFTNPLLLIGLVAILVPIIIHLFNFRRYKTVYFSNVKMLEDIKKKTKREQTLQQLVVLALRILGIAALVLAFAQPFIPSNKQKSKKGNLVTIFLDNSYSMEANSKEGSLLYDAVDAAKNIVNAFGFSDDFVLTTQNFSGEESHVLNKDQMLEMLDKIQASPNSHSFKDILTFEKNSGSTSDKGNVVHYYISDFQKNNFNIADLKTDSSTTSFLIPMPTKESNNVAIDSCWFMALFAESEDLQQKYRQAEAAYPGSLEIREAVVEDVLLPIAAEAGFVFTVEDLRKYETHLYLAKHKDEAADLDAPDDEQQYFLLDHGWTNDEAKFCSSN